MQIGCAPVLPQPESRLQIIWVGPDVCRLLATNLGCLQINVGSRHRIWSINLGRKSRCFQAGARMFASRYSYLSICLQVEPDREVGIHARLKDGAAHRSRPCRSAALRNCRNVGASEPPNSRNASFSGSQLADARLHFSRSKTPRPRDMPTSPPRDRPELPRWDELELGDLWSWPLPELINPLDRTILKASVALAKRQVGHIDGWDLVGSDRDPFLLVANHCTRRETVYLTAALMLARGGRPVHFLADWNFRLIPGVGYLYTRTGAIEVVRKDVRPRFLNWLKPLLAGEHAAFARARERLLAGSSVALFPEGTVNRDPNRLLRGRFGAARLSLETGVPVLPVGIRLTPKRLDLASASMSIRIGTPLTPPPVARNSVRRESRSAASVADVRAWHAEIMTVIGELSGKRWPSAVAADADPVAVPTICLDQ